MKIKSTIIIIMITCFALISCMTIISAADVPNGNHTDNHQPVINVQGTNNEPVMAQNTEIKTSNTKNNNIQRNTNNNKNNYKFQNQQSKLNPMEKQSLTRKQEQPDKPREINTTQQKTKMPEQDQKNIPTNMTPKFNDNTSPKIQKQGNNQIPEKEQPMENNRNNLNNNTIPQKLQQNINNTNPNTISNNNHKIEENIPEIQKNTNKNQQKQNNKNNKFMPTMNNNELADMNNTVPPMDNNKPDMNKTMTHRDNNKPVYMNNSVPPMDNNSPSGINNPMMPTNNNIPSNINNTMPPMDNTQLANLNNTMLPMENNKPEMNNTIIPTNNNRPSNINNTMLPMDNNRPADMNSSMVPKENNEPTDMINNMPSNNNMNSQSNDVSYSTGANGQLVVSGTKVTKNKSNYSVTSSETNTVLVQNGGTLTLTNSKITKTGDTTNSGNSEFLGTNAGILTTYGSTTYIKNSTIVTDATGSNAIFATNIDSSHSGATIYVNDTTIDTYQDKSRGLDATYGGTIIANNVTINTRGGSCAALATDRGEGTVTVSNSVLNTGVDNGTGQGSPCIYSTGKITAINSAGTAYGAQIACIEGKNSITLINSTLSCSGEGNRQENGKYIDQAGVFIYQSMSGDAEVGTAIFTATNSNLTIFSTSDYYKTAPMFYVTNTKGIVTITNTTLNYGSGVLIKVSNQNQWGTTGSNGGDLTFNAVNEVLKGKIIVGDYSSLSLDLKNSTYNGAITTSSSATSSVTIEAGSTWTLTGDSYLTSLTNYGKIICGNYKLYVNGVEYTA